MSKNYIIICDANSKVGFGHFSRCFNLARHISLTNPTSTFKFLGNYNSFAQNLMTKYNICFNSYFNNNKDKLKYINENADAISTVIVDSYDINESFIQELTTSEYKTVFFDDFKSFDYDGANLVINFTIDSKSHTYKSKATMLGLPAFMVKPEFYEIRNKNIKTQSISTSNILISISGTTYNETFNIENDIIKIIDNNFSDLNIICIIQNNNNTLPLTNNKIKYLNPIYNLETILSDTDLIITGGGLLKYESAYCCIPGGIISLNKGQENETKQFADEKLCFNLISRQYYSFETLEKNLVMFMKNEKIKAVIKTNCKKKFRTNSSKEVAQKIEQL